MKKLLLRNSVVKHPDENDLDRVVLKDKACMILLNANKGNAPVIENGEMSPVSSFRAWDEEVVGSLE